MAARRISTWSEPVAASCSATWVRTSSTRWVSRSASTSSRCSRSGLPPPSAATIRRSSAASEPFRLSSAAPVRASASPSRCPSRANTSTIRASGSPPRTASARAIRASRSRIASAERGPAGSLSMRRRRSAARAWSASSRSAAASKRVATAMCSRSAVSILAMAWRTECSTPEIARPVRVSDASMRSVNRSKAVAIRPSSPGCPASRGGDLEAADRVGDLGADAFAANTPRCDRALKWSSEVTSSGTSSSRITRLSHSPSVMPARRARSLATSRALGSIPLTLQGAAAVIESPSPVAGTLAPLVGV